MNRNPDAPKFHEWFFKAVDALVEIGVWRGRRGFAVEFGIDPGNFWKLAQHPEWDVPAQYMFWLVRDYGVRSEWLLQGKGKLFNKPPQPGWAKLEEA